VTTLKSIDLVCPNCDAHFSSEVVEVLETRGRKRTDFHVHRDGVKPLDYGVHLCAVCGFAGPEAWFGAEAYVSYDVQAHVWNELTPRMAMGSLPASEKYEFAAKVATWNGLDPRQLADLWLRAAWCAVDEGDIEAERFYRRHAVWNFEKALGTYDDVRAEDRAVITYLVGELWRRIGDTARSSEWFARVPHAVTNAREQSWLVRWANQQQADPQEWFVQ
jgi:uncharacterized protein (DUF2225 family)